MIIWLYVALKKHVVLTLFALLYVILYYHPWVQMVLMKIITEIVYKLQFYTLTFKSAEIKNAYCRAISNMRKPYIHNYIDISGYV